jgi:hypothetical protein
MIICPLCRGRAERAGRQWPYPNFQCEHCRKEFYLPAHLGCPADADLERQPLLLRYRLWELDRCMEFLLETDQIMEQERLLYTQWRAEELAHIEAMNADQRHEDG